MWKKLYEKRGWELHEWQAIQYAWTNEVMESADLLQLYTTSRSGDPFMSSKNGFDNYLNGIPWKLLFVEREFHQRLRAFITFDQTTLEKIFDFQQNCAKIMKRLQMVPSFVQLSNVELLCWVDK